MLATTSAPAFTFSRPSLTTSRGGESWFASAPTKGGSPSQATELWKSVDGDSWTQAPSLPLDLNSCVPFPESPRVVAGAAGEIFFQGAGSNWSSYGTAVGWTSSDAANSWSSPSGAAPHQFPTRELEVVRLNSNRLVALWLEGSAAPIALRAGVSDDDGLTWSPSVVVSDQSVSLRHEHPKFFYTEYRTRRFDAVATLSGGVVIAWLARSTDDCDELRVARSGDGLVYANSAVGGSIDGLPMAIAEDAASILVTTWIQAGDVVSARSLDGGANWSAAVTITSPSAAIPLLVTSVVTAGDGSLGIGVTRDRNEVAPSEVEYYRSDDGGLSWQRNAVYLEPWKPQAPQLVSAGPRLLLVWHRAHCAGGDCYEELRNLESTDFGASWTEIAYAEVWPSPRLLGDSDGNVYRTVYDNVWIQRPGSFMTILDWMPQNANYYYTDPSLIVVGSEKVAALFGDWSDRPPPGVFYAHVPCPSPWLLTPPVSRIACARVPRHLRIGGEGS